MKRKKHEMLAEHRDVAIKVASFQHIFFTYLGAQVAVIWLSTQGSLFPGGETIQSIAGTCAEIVAGLYGITMAGYTFFLSRIDGLMASDATLSYIVASIKRRFKQLVWIITINVLVTLTVSILLMYIPAPSNGNHAFYYRLFCNEFILSVGASFGLILYYSLKVIDPNCIEKEAKKLKKQIAPISKPAGSATEFIMLYDQIEEKCNAMLPQSVLRQIRENKGNQFAYTIALMRELPLDVKGILPAIEQIHMYYECTVNCRELTVAESMCQQAKWVLQNLERKTK